MGFPVRVRVSPTAPKRKENLSKFLKKQVFFRFTVLELCSSLCSDVYKRQLVTLHILAVIVHHFIFKDKILSKIT